MDLSSLTCPVIVKPNDEGSSKGIHDQPIAPNPAAAVQRARWLYGRYDCPGLVEEFLAGPEVTLGIGGNAAGMPILGAMEIAPTEPEQNWVYSLAVKRDWRRAAVNHPPGPWTQPP